MKTRLSILVVLVALLSSVIVAEAQNAHFTFKIPVQLTKLHRDIDKVMVQVFLFDGPAVTVYIWYDGNPSDPRQAQGKAVARTSTVMPVSSNGTVSRTITLKMNPKKPAEVQSYACILYLHNKKTNSWAYRCPSKQAWCATDTGKYSMLMRTAQIR